jgi:hypothetical protein
MALAAGILDLPQKDIPMRNTLLVSAAILVAGVAVASAQHAPGGGSQNRQPRSHDARAHDVSRPPSGQSRRSQGDVAGKAAPPQRARTAGSPQKSKGAGPENAQKPPQRAAAKRHGVPSCAEASPPRAHNARSGLPNRGANDHARSQAARRPPGQAMGRASEHEIKAQPHTAKTSKAGKITSKATSKVRTTAGAAPQSPSRRDSASLAGRMDVRTAQTALNQQGFNVGDPDGKLGQRTKKALIAFQKQHGFQTTGKVDRATLQALNTGGGQGAGSTKDSANKDGNQRHGPAPAAAAPQNTPAAPSTTEQGGAAPATTWPQPADGQTPAIPDGLQMPDAAGRVPAGAPQEDYKDDTLPSGDDQRR